MEIGTSTDLSAPLGPPPGLEGARGPGRPPISPAQRAAADAKHELKNKLLSSLPAAAKEFKLKIFDAHSTDDVKRSYRPVRTLLQSDLEKYNITDDDGSWAAFLESDTACGPGRYCIEAYDAANQRIAEVPAFFINAGVQAMDNEDEFPRDRRSRRGRGREREFDDGDDDYDDGPARVDSGELISTVAKASAAQANVQARNQSDMMTMMMMSQQEQARARAEEDRRREEREESRRRDDEARRREEDQRRRDEDQRREDRRREEDREERRAAEKREDERRAQHLEEVRRAEAATQSRMQLMLAGVTAVAPLLAKVFEKKDDPIVAALLANIGRKQETDPMQMVMFKSIMDRMSNDGGSSNIIQQMGEMQKLSLTMSTEQMRSMLATTNEFQQHMMKKAIDLAMSAPGNEDKKPFLEQLGSVLAGAADVVKTLVPAAPATPMLPQPQRRRIAPGPQQPQQAAPGQAPAPTAQAPEQPGQAAPAAVAPAPEAAQEDLSPKSPVEAVLHGLYALKTGGLSVDDTGTVKGYIVRNMPVDLRVALLRGDQASVIALVQPYLAVVPAHISTWAQRIETLTWLPSAFEDLQPLMLQTWGPKETQEAELAHAMEQHQQAQAQASLAPGGGDMAIGLDGSTSPQVIPGPGSEQRQAPAEQAQPDQVAPPAQPVVDAVVVPDDAPEPTKVAVEIIQPEAPAAASKSHLED